MSLSPDWNAALNDLLERLLDGDFSDDDRVALNAILKQGADQRRYYRNYLKLHGELEWRIGEADRPSQFSVLTEMPPVVPVALTATQGEPENKTLASISEYLIARTPWSEYVVGGIISAVVMIGLGVGLWMWKISDVKSFAQKDGNAAAVAKSTFDAKLSGDVASPDVAKLQKAAKPVVVGRITDQADCRWKLVGNKASGKRKLPVPESDARIKNQQGANAPRSPSVVCLGDRLTVTSGLMEITFNSGAKVLLEGPCRFNVETNGGYLAVGRLTGKLEKRGEGRLAPASTPGDKVGDEQLAVAGAKPQAASPTVTPTPTSFVIATPTAIVTDLGTEFGVEVAQDGETTSHVFRGSIRFQSVGRNVGGRVETSVLHENESVRATIEKNRQIKVLRVASAMLPKTFCRSMPNRRRIPLFNTGVDAMPGDPDPHWQIVAVEIDPRWQIAPVKNLVFEPQPALVFAPARPCYNAIRSPDSQWITPNISNKTPPGLYTFRTTFDLSRFDSATARLHGGFAVDNHVEAIRLNGHSVPVPWHPAYGQWIGSRLFDIRQGFVQGVNTLDFIVRNDPSQKPSSLCGDSFTALQVKLDGSAVVPASEQ